MYFLIAIVGIFSNALAKPVEFGNARFTVVSPSCFRIEYDIEKKFLNERSLFATREQELDPRDYEVKIQGQQLQISTQDVVLTYLDDGKALSASNLKAELRHSSVIWNPSLKNEKNLGGTLPALDYAKPPMPVHDGLLSLNGWYWLDDSTSPILDATGWIQTRPTFKGQHTDGFLFLYGKNYQKALKDLTLAGGIIPIPRKFAFGSWYSRWWAYSSKDYRQIVREFRQHDFPLDVLVMDMDWHKKDAWGGLSWDRKLLPDAEKLLSELQDENIYVSLNDHPSEGLQPFEDVYPEFMREMGEDPSSRKTIPYNNGDKKYMSTLFRVGYSPLEKQGVDFWWLDWMGNTSYPFNILPWANELYFRQTLATGLRGLGFSRWGGWGGHRIPIQFSGDTLINWETLKFLIPFTANSGNVGASYWSHDIGGFIDSKWNWFFRRKNAELMARWTQFGAVSPVMRLHSANRSYLDKRPWLWGKQAENSMRASFHLRSELLPYIYSMAFQTNKSALPLVRPMYLLHPESDWAYQFPHQYYFGDALVAAPITAPGEGKLKLAKQTVRLPRGRWFNFFTNQEVASDRAISVQSDINSFPLFARGGYPIVLRPYSHRPTTERIDNLRVRIYPAMPGETFITEFYDDDGLTRSYENGEYTINRIETKNSDNKLFVQIHPRQGNYEFEPGRITLELPGRKSSSVVARGADATWNYDSSRQITLITLTSLSLSKGLEVEVDF